jgi:hypothetical protein
VTIQQESHPAKGWWYARFRIKWAEETEPLWHIDLLLAHRVAAPLLHTYRNEIALWRFHRRAARDSEGHQFSLTFYATPATADKIFNSLRSDIIVKKMKRAGLIIQDIYDDTARVSTPRIEDTSDGTWSPQIRKSWPFFIMGVCQMWLSLITEVAANMPDQSKSLSLPKMMPFYQKVSDTIKTLWREQGAHSLLHHLNAIFGYEPVFVREMNLRRF